ncbi:MAG: ABC transporter permease [Aestuariivirga sp.]|uniref:ABC transporter permease n=1 Tax=Aestuariivirga sp. TaxID=2650926 RepID=UPI0025BF9F00|nr:ABC transporter permease [Aestuariivirga sp.]MCA3560868.1 ABC transporter permease [Aestuariivirga sp.]
MKTASGSPVSNPWAGILPAILLMAGFFAVPILYTIGLSFSSDAHQGFTLDNYRTFFAEARLVDALSRTLILGLSVVVVSSLIAFPAAYFLAFVVAPAWRAVCLFVLVAPFWTSFTIRAFSWQLVLSDTGVIAWLAGEITGLTVSLGFLYTMAASIFGLSLFSIMLITLMIYSVMITIDRRLIEANTVLGGSGWSAFREVILPLSLPGWMIGAVLTFIIAVGDYAVPALLGGGFKPVLAQVMLSVLKGTYDLPTAATFASILVLLILAACTPLLLVVRSVRLQG